MMNYNQGCGRHTLPRRYDHGVVAGGLLGLLLWFPPPQLPELPLQENWA
jgi:hypothetical protein